MSRFVISYDLCAKCFKHLEKGDSKKTAFYKAVRETVKTPGGGFEEFLQYSVYTCPQDSSNTLKQAQDIFEKIKEIPDYEKYVISFQVFEMFDCTDLMVECVEEHLSEDDIFNHHLQEEC
jgi:virulence-associated protein VapD